MPNMTLAMDDAIMQEIRAHPEIRWTEVARQAIQRKLRELHALDAALQNSRLTQADVERLARKANASILKRLGH